MANSVHLKTIDDLEEVLTYLKDRVVTLEKRVAMLEYERRSQIVPPQPVPNTTSTSAAKYQSHTLVGEMYMGSTITAVDYDVRRAGYAVKTADGRDYLITSAQYATMVVG